MPGGHVCRAAALVFVLWSSIIGQPANGPAFEAASVKPADIKLRGRIIPVSGGPGTSDPGHVTFTNVALKNVVARAYDVRPDQVEGPGWLDSELYTIEAVLPPDTAIQSYRRMLQNLIAERFHLVLHHESRMFHGYELVVAKSGLKINESATSAGSPDPPSAGRPVLVADEKGTTRLDRPGLVLSLSFGEDGILSAIAARDRPMSDLVDMLIRTLHQPVLDGTDLPGNYDFTVKFSANQTPGVAGVDIFTALQEQCGLKLEARRMSLDMIVIDRADKIPAEN